MTKIMLVEDDNNLREIYGARLMAEGYEIVAARDGEEALALAVKEKPDLVISDVMMPKISGFDMLDILRSTEETKHSKVIMMTALSQQEDKERGEKLGADRYLVKSQVTLEDVVAVVGEVLNGEQAPAPAPAAPAAQPSAPVQPAPAPEAPAPAPQPAAPAPQPETPQPIQPPAPAPAAPPLPQPAPAQPGPQIPQPPQIVTKPSTPQQQPAEDGQDGNEPQGRPLTGGQKVIQPLKNNDDLPDINALLAKELAEQEANEPAPPAQANEVAIPNTPPPMPEQNQQQPIEAPLPSSVTIEEEQNEIAQQISQFEQSVPEVVPQVEPAQDQPQQNVPQPADESTMPMPQPPVEPQLPSPQTQQPQEQAKPQQDSPNDIAL